MARNDVVLLDSLIEKAKPQYGEYLDISEAFELFCFDQILKNYELSYDDLEFGWVDGGRDGGIDGLFVFLEDQLMTEQPDYKAIRRNPHFELFIFTCKHSPSFKQEPINKLISSLPELFDLQKDQDEIIYPFGDDILAIQQLFKNTYIQLASKHPTLSISVIYASRGTSSNLDITITSRSELLKNELSEFFSDLEVNFSFMGASELLQLSRQHKTYTLGLKFIENNISRQKTNYVLLSLLTDYFDFVTDDEGRLRRYLFESNVRDYLGDVQINRDIASTLSEARLRDELDFWWLNNGVTILASNAIIAGKEINLDNVQIVNGLQSTETIYKYFATNAGKHDDRAILIKIIVTDKDEVRDRIIKATNYQSPVAIASLRATDKIQRDIEHYLYDYGWYYERRNNYYKNQGKSSDRIISVSYLGAVIHALFLKDLNTANRQKTKFMRDEEKYRRVFNETWPLDAYRRGIEIVKSVDDKLPNKARKMGIRKKSIRQLKFIVSLLAITFKLEKLSFTPYDILDLSTTEVSDQEVDRVLDYLLHIKKSNRQKAKHISNYLSHQFIDAILQDLKKSH